MYGGGLQELLDFLHTTHSSGLLVTETCLGPHLMVPDLIVWVTMIMIAMLCKASKEVNTVSEKQTEHS